MNYIYMYLGVILYVVLKLVDVAKIAEKVNAVEFAVALFGNIGIIFLAIYAVVVGDDVAKTAAALLEVVYHMYFDKYKKE